MHHPKRIVLVIAVSGLALVAAACGDSGVDSARDRPAKTVDLEMVDIGFTPQTIEVAKGDAVRFVFTNRGKIRHEAYLGTKPEQLAHEEEMKDGTKEKMGGHDAHGGGDRDGSMITVEPGDSGELETTFGESGTYEIGCHEPGHYDAGMKITVEVS